MGCFMGEGMWMEMRAVLLLGRYICAVSLDFYSPSALWTSERRTRDHRSYIPCYFFPFFFSDKSVLELGMASQESYTRRGYAGWNVQRGPGEWRKRQTKIPSPNGGLIHQTYDLCFLF